MLLTFNLMSCSVYYHIKCTIDSIENNPRVKGYMRMKRGKILFVSQSNFVLVDFKTIVIARGYFVFYFIVIFLYNQAMNFQYFGLGKQEMV